MRITINQDLLDRRHEESGVLRLSAQPSDRSVATVGQLAALVLRLGVPFADLATVEPGTPLARHG